MSSIHKLSRPSTPDEWNAYHSIRQKVLFENRGRFGIYQEDHPDEFKENHNPLLLFFDGGAIGTVRIDLVPERKMAILRLVAIKEEFQRKGHGEKLLALSEEFAMSKGCSALVLNAANDAIHFYRKYGFEEMIWSQEERNDKSIQMKKVLSLQPYYREVRNGRDKQLIMQNRNFLSGRDIIKRSNCYIRCGKVGNLELLLSILSWTTILAQ